MRDLAILAIHLIATIAKLLLPGGARSVVSGPLLLKHPLLILNRSRGRAPNLRPIDRIIASLCAGLMRPARLLRSAIVLRPSTHMAFHRALVNRKYRLLFAPRRRKQGPKGPTPELIAAIIEMKRRNPRFGCRRIANRSPSYSVSRSTRMWCVGCPPNTVDRLGALTVRRGLPSSAMRRTVSGASIFFVVSR